MSGFRSVFFVHMVPIAVARSTMYNFYSSVQMLFVNCLSYVYFTIFPVYFVPDFVITNYSQ